MSLLEARERMLRDIDPSIVAEQGAALQAWAQRMGHPKRCKTGEVHPGLGCCLFCGAEMGEICRAELANQIEASKGENTMDIQKFNALAELVREAKAEDVRTFNLLQHATAEWKAANALLTDRLKVFDAFVSQQKTKALGFSEVKAA